MDKLEDLSGVYTFTDAQKVAAEIAAIQQESTPLPQYFSAEQAAYWRGRQQMAEAILMVLNSEHMVRLYVNKFEERSTDD